MQGFPILLFLGLVAIGIFLTIYSQQQSLSAQRSSAQERGLSAAGFFVRQLDRALSVTAFLGESMRQFPNLVSNNFTQFVTPLLADPFIGVLNLQWAPGAIIKYIVPLAGNEKAIGARNVSRSPLTSCRKMQE